jgi:GH24 family phage-related lysozyme (muramidase)
MAYLDDSLAHVEGFEGIVPWMYLDTRGFVTVGVGEMLANAARAQSLGFVDANSQPVGADVILAEYNRVSALSRGQVSGFYRAPTSPVLPHPQIDSLLRDHLTFFDGQLNQRFSAYSNFPDPAKLGLLDMIFNLGVTGLFKGFPTFMGFVQNQDWANAATQCHRNGPNAERNDWTKQQFLDAAEAVSG